MRALFGLFAVALALVANPVLADSTERDKAVIEYIATVGEREGIILRQTADKCRAAAEGQADAAMSACAMNLGRWRDLLAANTPAAHFAKALQDNFASMGVTHTIMKMYPRSGPDEKNRAYAAAVIDAVEVLEIGLKRAKL